MAITLQITDGTDTVDLNDGSNLYLGAAFQMNVGEGAVTEQIIAGWANGLTADQKAVISKKFNRLIRKAILHYREQRIDRAVWLVWKPDDQTDTQYAKVMGGGEVEIVKHTVGGWGGGYFNPTIIREGAWRHVAPDGTAGAAIHTGITRYNKSDGDGDNWFDIANTRTNDAPGLIKLTISSNTQWDNLTIARKRFANSTAADKFNPHFNPTDMTDLDGGSNNSEGSAPGDEDYQVSANAEPMWEIAGSDLEYYRGTYRVYCKVTQSGDASIAFSTSAVSGATATHYDIDDAVDEVLYLGTHTIPGIELDPFVSTASSGAFEIGLDIDVNSGTVTIIGMWLIPVDLPPAFIVADPLQLVSTLEVVINGITETIFVATVSNGAPNFSYPVTLSGRYPTYNGGELTRFFLYSSMSGTGVTHNATFTIDCEVVDRFIGLRGNT